MESRSRFAISGCDSPSFCGISGDLAPSTRRSLAIVRLCDFGCAKCVHRVLQEAPPKGRQLYFIFPSAPDPLFKASKAPFLTLRVATPSGAPRQAPLDVSRVACRSLVYHRGQLCKTGKHFRPWEASFLLLPDPPTLAFLKKKQGKHRKKARVFLFAEPLKSLEKKGKTPQKKQGKSEKSKDWRVRAHRVLSCNLTLRRGKFSFTYSWSFLLCS